MISMQGSNIEDTSDQDWRIFGGTAVHAGMFALSKICRQLIL
jgi:hypothetical protein